MAEQALDAARAAEAEIARGGYRTLHGVPVSLKDLVFVSGVRNTAGSASMADYVPGFDAAVVERLRAAHAVIVGKAQTYEFAMGRAPPTLRQDRNPWDLERVTVGSSSGSAAGVSARMVFGSVGTDTGGSIRTGLRLRRRRVQAQHRPGQPVRGAAAELDPGPRRPPRPRRGRRRPDDPRDRGLRRARPRLGRPGAGRPRRRRPDRVDGLRFAVPEEFFFDGVDPEFHAAFDAAADALQDAGMTRVPIRLPMIEHAQTAHSTIVLGESYSVHEDLFLARGPASARAPATAWPWPAPSPPATTSEPCECAPSSATSSAKPPTTPTSSSPSPRPPIRSGSMRGLPHAFGTGNMTKAGNRFTRMANLIGIPAVSVPCGFTGSGLPVGLQIVGRPAPTPPSSPSPPPTRAAPTGTGAPAARATGAGPARAAGLTDAGVRSGLMAATSACAAQRSTRDRVSLGRIWSLRPWPRRNISSASA